MAADGARPCRLVVDRGCYHDPNARRVFNNGSYEILTGGNWHWCAGIAATRGRKVFGMEAGNQCWMPTYDYGVNWVATDAIKMTEPCNDEGNGLARPRSVARASRRRA